MSLNKFKLSPTKIFVFGFLGLGLVAFIANNTTWFDGWASNSVTIPQFTSSALAGQQAYEANCQSCHGKDATGSSSGPPLLNDIYNPGHHDDESFYRAMKRGTRQHHWRFGNMPPQPQVNEQEGRHIVQYVRELQEANGILYKPHRM